MAEYSGRYEETQGYSPRFVAFARDLAARWVDRYKLHERDILEIGCGKGEFLQYLCEMGPNRGVGIDPSYDPDRMDSDAANRMRFIRDFYDERYADMTGDAVVCRHTLEHIPAVGDFLAMVRRSIGRRHETAVLFELPDVFRVLEEIAFWDLYYEHCSYFTLGSLTRLFRSSGFEPLHVSVEFDNQYLVMEAKPDGGSGQASFVEEEDLEATAKAVDHFENQYLATVARWRSEVVEGTAAGRRTVIWGAGSKGVAYLTTLGIEDEVRFAVDINPHKHGMFMAGTGHEIVAPEFLRTYRPDEVIVMNPVYVPEIEANLRALSVDAVVRAV
jgi:SAM-dependent methyltransferase